MRHYKTAPGSRVHSLGGKHMVTVFPTESGGEPFAMEVNESFALLFGKALERQTFTEADIAEDLRQNYAMEAEKAQAETEKILQLWLTQHLVAEQTQPQGASC